MQKARSQTASPAEAGRRPPTACGHVVSGSLSLPARGCFSPVPHGTRPLSVTRESSALEGGPPGFAPGSSYRALLRTSTGPSPSPSPTGLSPAPVPRPRGLRLASLGPPVGPTTPNPSRTRFRPRTVSLAATPVISRGPEAPRARALLISPPPGTEMFQFPGFALRSDLSDGDRSPPGSPIRPPLAQRVCAAPQGLSQLTAAFLASVCPGIPHMPSLA